MADCPQRQAANVASMEAAQVTFVAVEQDPGQEWNLQAMDGGSNESQELALITQDVIQGCMGVIDSGATASLGSAQALEEIMKVNYDACGDGMMTVDPQNRPTFRFGNGNTTTCLSTACLGLGADGKRGTFEVHVHDHAGQPVLISKKSLKALGAVIDFGESRAIYKAVNPRKVVDLVEAPNGHLLMPLTGDILEGAIDRGSDFVSLSE